MTLTASFPTEDASGNPIDDTRRIFGGMVAAAADGTPRLGVIDPDPSTPLVTGTTSMAYLIKGDVLFVTQRDSSTGGVELSANDAVASAATTSAPVANSRIDVIWIKCQFDAYGDSGLYAPRFGVTQGTAGATPAVPSIPAGATALALGQVTSSDTTTETVVITQVAPFTAMAGGVVPVRNSTELDAWEPADGAVVFDLDEQRYHHRINGAWVKAGLQATVYRSSGTHNITSTDTAYTWSGVKSGSDAGFWSAGNPTRMTAPVSGRYLVTGSVKAGSGGCEIEYRPRVNGTALSTPTFAFSAGDPGNTAWPRVWGTFEVPLTAGDYVELFVRKLVGSDSTVIAAETYMQMRLLP